MADGAAPGEKQDDADQDEGETEAGPNAESAPAAAKTEPGSKRQTNYPITREVAEHRCAGVASSAEGAGGHGLNSIEELKGGARSQQKRRAADDDFIGRVHQRDPARKHQEHGGVAGFAGGDRFAAADGLAHADGSRGRDAERNHVREGDGVESDLVTGEGDGAEASDESGGERENADFKGDLNGRGQAEEDEAPNADEINVHGSFEQLGAVAAVVPKQIADKDERQIHAGKRGGPPGTDDAHGRSAPFAVDENPVEEGVDDVGGDQREGHGPDQIHGLNAAADSEIEEQRKESEGQRLHVRHGEGGNGGVNTKTAEERAEKPKGCHEQRGHGDGEIGAINQRAMTIFALAGAEGLGNQGIESNEESAAEEGEHVEQIGADGDGANGAGALRKMADHDGIDDAHGHPADLGKDEREGEAHSWAQLAAKCSEADHGSEWLLEV